MSPLPTLAARRALPLFLGANVLFGAGLFAHAFLYNFYLTALGHDVALMGAAAAALTAGGLAALVPAGLLLDRFGAASVYRGACLVAGLGLLAGAVVERPALLLGAALVAGAGTAAWRVAMGPIIMRLADGPTRARIFSWNVALLLGSGAAWTAGAGALPAALERALGVTLLGGVRSVLALGALLTVLAGLVQALVQVPAAPSAASLAGQRARWLGALPGPRILVAVAAVAVWMCAGGLVIPFFNVYFARVHELPVARIGMVFALAQAVTAGVLVASGAAAGKVGARRMLVLWMLVFAPALWALAATSLLPLALALFLLQGLVSPATNPLIDQVLLDATAPDRHGVVSSWRNAATETSGLVGAALGGVLLARSSFTALFTVAGAVAAAGAGLVLLALRYSLAESDTRRRTIRSSLSA